MAQYAVDKTHLLKALKQRFGHDHFLPSQAAIIDSLLAGRDSLVIMPTGSGKSICYQLPALFLDGLGLVVSPLIALMKDQVDALCAKGVRAAFINSTMTPSEQHRVQAEAARGNLDILYVAPERLALAQFKDFLRTLQLGLIAIDEAHCISEWGHDFRPDYRKLQTLQHDFPGIPIIALTATATERVREDILHQLGITKANQFVTSFNRPNLIYHIKPKRKSFDTLVGLIGKCGADSVIIYCSSRKKTEELAQKLSSSGLEALPYHAGLGSGVRQKTQEHFLGSRVSIIVATIAFGMGIDKANVRLVVHYDLPKSIEGYYQETGRAGRDGLSSDCVLFFSYGDKSQQDFFIRQIKDDTERLNAEKKLMQMVEYCQTRSCRRQFLLNYFGEVWPPENCGACDVCLPAEGHLDFGEEFDGTKLTQKILSAIVRTEGRFGANHIVDVLRGSHSRRLLTLGHDRLSVYGIAKETRADDLRDTIDQLVDGGLVERASEGFPILALTTSGKEFLKKHDTITLVRRGNNAPVLRSESVTGEHDELLFEKLRELRKGLANELGLPAFVVFHDKTLRQMASEMPRDRAGLLRIGGVGQDKLERFGDDFIAAIVMHAASVEGVSGEALSPAAPDSPPRDSHRQPSQSPNGPPVDIDKIVGALRDLESSVLQHSQTREDDSKQALEEALAHLALARVKIRGIK